MRCCRAAGVTHEDFHVRDFYDRYWPTRINDFQNNVEKTLNQALAIFYDCDNPQTTTQNGSLSLKKGTWDINIHAANNAAFDD